MLMVEVAWALTCIFIASVVFCAIIEDTWRFWEVDEGWLYPVGSSIGIIFVKVVS